MQSRRTSLAKLLAPALGLSFLWPYFRASFLSFLTVFAVHPTSVVHAAYVAYVATFAAITLCAALAGSHISPLVCHARTPLALGVCGSLGSCLLWFSGETPFSPVCCVAGTIFVTAFFAGSLLCYGARLARWDAREVAAVGFASFGIGFIDNLALASPQAVAAAFCLVTPIICGLCAPRASMTGTPSGTQSAASASHKSPAAHDSAALSGSHSPLALLGLKRTSSNGALLALIVLLALFCLTGNLMRGLTNPWFSYGGPTLRSLCMSLANLAFAAVSLLLLWRGVSVRKVLFWNWTVCMATFFAGLLGLSFAGGTLASLGSDVATVSRVCFTLLMFLFALEARRLTSLDPAQLLGLFLLMPEALSGLVRYIVVPSLLMATGVEPLAATSYAGMAVMLVLTVAIALVLGNLLLRQVDNLPSSQAEPEGQTAPRGREAALSAVAHDFGLTTREAQTASYVSQGYSLEKTADMLGISINTVRTHMRSIYNKLAIHSRQELIDLLDEQE